MRLGGANRFVLGETDNATASRSSRDATGYLCFLFVMERAAAGKRQNAELAAARWPDGSLARPVPIHRPAGDHTTQRFYRIRSP